MLFYRPGFAFICCLALTAGTAPGAPPAPTPTVVAPGQVRQIKVVADKAPDCSSLKSMVESVTRGCRTNDEKAIAIYNFQQLVNYHQGYPAEKGGVGALKEINVYGWSLCGGLHTVEAALWREMGWKWRYVGWSDPGHTTVEAEYDGRWHYLDTFLKFYAWTPDPKAPGGRTIASQADIKADPTLVTRGLVFDRSRAVYYHSGNRFENIGGKANWRAPALLTCGDGPQAILSGIKTNVQSGSPTDWAGIAFDSPNYSTDVNLAPGYSLDLTWDGIEGSQWWSGRRYVPGHSCGDKDYRNSPVIGPIFEPYRTKNGYRRAHSNGTLLFAPDFANAAFLSGLAAKDNVKLADGKLVPVDAARPASITVELQSPYIMSRATGKADGIEKAAVSIDGGKTFKAVDLDDFSEAVGGNYSCLVKLTFAKPLGSLELRAVVQCNNGALPYLSPGKNKIAVTAADARDLGDNRLVVTYAYRTGFRTKSYEKLADEGAELGRAHNAIWSDEVTVVQKVFAAKDLPATFDIDVPTPKDKYPVYPRMLFVRREVLAPGSKPLPLPEGAVTTKPVSPKELLTLPNPFTVGIGQPDKK